LAILPGQFDNRKCNSKNMRDSFSLTSPKLEVGKTTKYGKGVFAKGKFKKDEIITVFGGYIMSRKDELLLPSSINDNGIFISDDIVLGIKKKSEIEIASYFNHSCSPNSGFKGQIFLVAMRDIEKGEEITFDYAMVLHKSKNLPPYKMKCFCLSKDCRKIVSDSDWKNKYLQKKYKGYFQFYLQEKINKQI